MIKNIKYIHIINIYIKKHSLEEFIKNINNNNREFIRKRNIKKDLLTNYKKLLLQPNNKIFNYKHSFFLNNIS